MTSTTTTPTVTTSTAVDDTNSTTTITTTTTTTISTTTLTTSIIETTEPETTTVTTVTARNGNSESGSMGGGEIAGIVIGCLLAVCVVLGVVFFLWRRKKKEKKRKQLLENNPLPGIDQLQQMDEEKVKESKKQKQKQKQKQKTKKPKPPPIEPDPSSVSSVGYVNIPKKRESPYANTTKDGAPAVPFEKEPIDEEENSDYLVPENQKLEYSGPGGIGYYMTKSDEKKEGNYDLPTQRGKNKNSEDIELNNLTSQSGKDYVNVPQKLPPGQAPKPGKSIQKEQNSDDFEQLVYENVENEESSETNKT